MHPRSLLVLLVFLIGCQGGGGGGGGGSGVGTDPRSDSPVAASRVTLTGTASPETRQVTVSGFPGFLQPDGSFVAPGIPLIPGENLLSIDEWDADDQPLVSRVRTIERSGDVDPARLELSTHTAAIDESVTARVISPFTIVRTWVDFDGDGVLDLSVDGDSATHRYALAGRTSVWAVVLTASGHHFSTPRSSPASRVTIGAKPEVVARASFEDGVALASAPDARTFWTATQAGRLQLRTAALDEISSFEAGFSVDGLSVDGAGDLFLLSTLSGEVHKRHPDGQTDSAFGVDGILGDSGDERASLVAPSAVLALTDGRLLVADAEPNRLVLFDGRGGFLAEQRVPFRIRRLSGNGNLIFVLDGQGRLRLIDGGLTSVEFWESIESARDVFDDATRHRLVVSRAGSLELVGYTGERHARLTGLGLTDVVAGVSLADPEGSRLIVLERGPARLKSILLPSDAPELQPSVVWQRFLNRARSSDLDAASELLAVDLRPAFRAAVEDLTPEEVDAIFGTFGDVVWRETSADCAFFDLTVAGAAGGRSVTLCREGARGLWFIQAF